jgi:hypothetical protein
MGLNGWELEDEQRMRPKLAVYTSQFVKKMDVPHTLKQRLTLKEKAKRGFTIGNSTI